MMGPKVAVPFVVCLTCFAIAPFAAAEEAHQEPVWVATSAVSVAPAVCAAPSELQDGPGEPVLLAVTGQCTAIADCWDGSQRTCTASGPTAECSATDSNCPAVRGNCWSSDEGTKSCPRCPCTAPPCTDYEGKKCKPGTQSPECSTFGVCAHCFCSSSGIYICP